MMSTLVDRRERVDGIEIRLLRGGRGAPLVFLHGSGGRPDDLPFLTRLADRFQVVVPEHPGFGTTERLDWVRAMPDLALFYRHVVRDVLGLAPVTLVGHNVGGWLAAECAVWFPDLVDRLVLIDAHGLRPAQAPALDLFTAPAERLRAAGWADPAKAPPPRPVTELAGIRNRAMTAQLAWEPRLYDPRLPERLRWVTAPTLVIWGAADAVVPVAHAAAYEHAIPGARVEVIADAGHYPHIEQPAAVAAAVTAFVESSRGRTA